MKKIVSLAVVVILLLSLAACGTAIPDGTEPETTENTKPTTAPTQKPTTPDKETESTSGNASNLSYEELEAEIESAVESTLTALAAELETVTEGIDSYETYIAKASAIEAFYEKINSTCTKVCIQMRQYSVDYATAILASGKSTDDMYDDLDSIYDLIYDDMGEDIYDGIYDEILDEMSDAFYNGALKERPDGIEYADWFDTRSDEYKLWFNTRSDVYEQWSDFRTDVFEFCSDMRSDLFSDDVENARDKIADFQKDILKQSDKLEGAGDEEPTTPTQKPTEPEKETESDLVDGMRPEFKEAMDSYEAFYDEYCEFMEAYYKNPANLTLLGQYVEIMDKAEKADKAFDAWDSEELNNAELKYYLEVSNRITQKLIDVTG